MKIVGYIAMIALCVITTAFVVYIGYLTFYPFKVIEIKNEQDLPIDKKNYVAGSLIAITFDYHKYMDIPPKVKKEIVCDRSVTELMSERRLPKGAGIVRSQHTIPVSTPTDNHCRIFIFIQYEVNPLQTQDMTLRTNEFSVTNAKP